MSGGLFPVSAKQRKEPVTPRPRLCPPSSEELTPDQVVLWCEKVEALRRADREPSDETHLYHLGLGPSDPRAVQILAALAER